MRDSQSGSLFGFGSRRLNRPFAGCRYKDRFCTVSHIQRVIAAFENKDDLAITIFFRQC